MAAVAIAAGILNNGNNRCALNHQREGCNTMEDDYFALRLRRIETHVVAVEYVAWRRQAGDLRADCFCAAKNLNLI